MTREDRLEKLTRIAIFAEAGFCVNGGEIDWLLAEVRHLDAENELLRDILRVGVDENERLRTALNKILFGETEAS